MNYLYVPESFLDKKKICGELCEAVGSGNRLAIFESIKGLTDRLKSFNNPEIVTLLGVKPTDMPGIAAIRERFIDATLIILLSEDDKEVFNEAIRLQPRFLGIMADDLDKVAPIVRKMIENSHRNYYG